MNILIVLLICSCHIFSEASYLSLQREYFKSSFLFYLTQNFLVEKVLCDLQAAVSYVSASIPSLLKCNANTPTMNNLRCCNVSSSPVVVTTIDLLSDDNSKGTQYAIKGTIPTSIGLLSNLVTLKLGFQSIYGKLPSEIGMMSSLSLLALQDNSLTGTIPTTIGYLKLSSLTLSYQNFAGVLPSEIGNMVTLTYLALQNNAFEGNIPTSFGRLSNLQTLNLGNNVNAFGSVSIPPSGPGLRGPIPSTFGGLAKVMYLNLGNNLLSGTIPSSLATLSSLTELDLDVNFLSGSVPASFCNSSATMRVFRFSVNQLCCYATCLATSPGNKVFGASDSLDKGTGQRCPVFNATMCKMKSCSFAYSQGQCSPTNSPTNVPTRTPTSGEVTVSVTVNRHVL